MSTNKIGSGGRSLCEFQNYFAEPLNLKAKGFTFSDYEDFEEKAEALRDSCGNKVDEYDIQIIDDDRETSELFNSCRVRHTELPTWFDYVVDLTDYQKAQMYFLVSIQGNSMFTAVNKYGEVALENGYLKDATRDWFDEVYLPDVPDFVKYYIDYNKFARDCEVAGDMTEFEFAGQIYTCTNSNCL